MPDIDKSYPFDKIVSAKIYNRYGAFDDGQVDQHLQALRKNLSYQNPIWNDLYIIASVEVLYVDARNKYYIAACPIKEEPDWYNHIELYNQKGEKYSDKMEKAMSYFISFNHVFNDDALIGLKALKEVFDDINE